ncbi:Uncharacterised protein [uncultured archaeon]|nr:Uncharacterised protein [uncultured archaeon]
MESRLKNKLNLIKKSFLFSFYFLNSFFLRLFASLLAEGLCIMGFARFECVLPNYTLKLDLTDPSESDLIGFFEKVEEACRNSFVFYSPLNAKSLLSESKGKNFFGLISNIKPMVLQNELVHKHSELVDEPTDESLLKKVKEKNIGIKSVVLSAFLNSVYDQTQFKEKPASTKVFLAVQSPNLTLVKKAPVNPDNGDVLLALVGSWNTAFSFLEAKFSLPETRLKLNEIQSVLKSMNSSKEKLVLVSLMKNAGYPLMLANEDFNKIHPELKISKPRGNYGKKKK